VLLLFMSLSISLCHICHNLKNESKIERKHGISVLYNYIVPQHIASNKWPQNNCVI
jgi:hypothetical protein